MKHYELTYIISSEIASEEAEAYAQNIDSFIQNKEGVIIKSEKPVAKALSFPIKKMGSGYFVSAEFQIEPEKVKEIEKKLQKDEKILRCIIVIKKRAKPAKERRVKKIEPIEPVIVKEKIELEEIDKKLDEILGE